MADDLIKVTLAMESEDVSKTIKSIEKLEKQIVKLQAEYGQYRKSLADGMIDQNKYAIGVAQTDAKIAHLTKTLHSGDAAINKHAEHLVQAKNKMSKFGMVSQQVGYQVGDFFVQVQSGQSALVAFGQQGTQLAGLLPGIYGAIVGISLAVGTMLVKSYMEAQGETKKLSEAVKDLGSSIEDYLKLSADNVDMAKKIKDTYGEVTQQFIELEERIQALSFRQMTLDAMAAAKALGDVDFGGSIGGELEDIRATFKLGEKEGYVKDPITKLFSQVDPAKDLQDLMKAVDTAMATSPEAALDATRTLGAAILDAVGGVNKLTGESLTYYKDITTAEKQLSQLVQIRNGELKGINKSDETAAQKAEDAIADAKELLRLKREEAALEELIVAQGEDSVAARAKNADNAAQTAKAKWEEKFAADGISATERDIINQLMEAARLHEVNKDRIADAKDEARELEKALKEAATAFGNMLTFGDGLDKSFAVVTAKVKALKADMDATVAASTAGSLFDAGLKRDKAIEAGADPAEVNTEYQRQVELIGQINALLTEESNIKAALKAANATEKETPADKLTKEAFALDSKLNKQRAVMGLSGEQLYVEEMRYALIDKIGQEEAKNFTLEIDRVAKILAAKQQLIALDQQRADFADLVADSFADSFMSIVDGTATVKEAFRAMALDIVKHLFKVLVMQQAINAIGGAMSGSSNALVKSLGGGLESYKAANGAAFSGGNVIPFASGGVVGSPTNFAMSGGRTGLMGEAGPEAIMPLKRGPDGKLGVATTSNSQSVTVVQNINVSTGVQQTVRAEVMGLMPQIAAASKAAVLDAKRRGGSFGGSFR
jgi:lambda family phage tail tape measure protein